MPATSCLHLFKATAVNGKITGTTLLSVAMPGWFFMPIAAAARKRSETGGSTSPTMSVGNDSPDYDNIQDVMWLAGTLGEYYIEIPPIGDTGKKVIDLTNPVYLNITVAGLSTTITVDVFVIGILFQ